MNKDLTCKHCGTVFENINPKVFANHVRWCNENPNIHNRKEVREKTNKTRKENSNKLYKQKEELYNLNPKICKNCGDIIPFSRKHKIFCDKPECIKAAHAVGGHALSPAQKYNCELCNKELFYKLNPKLPIICNNCKRKTKTNIYYNICKFCQNTFITKKSDKKYCKTCNKGILTEYRKQTCFHFNLADFPNEFEFNLINEFKWYNCKTNSNGISRDHIISTIYGFKNNIDPKILSHPANCRLIRQNENITKREKLTIITFQELLDKIYLWEMKYGKYYKKILVEDRGI